MLTTFRIISIILVSIWLNACSGLLPTLDKKNQSPWTSFAAAKASFDKIVPQETTHDDLKKLGFDPFETPNMKLITYLDIIQKFIPNESISFDDLDPGIQACLKAKADCHGYEVTPQEIKNERYGNVLLDLFNFRRKTKISGWRFSALIVLKNGLVVYKLWGGEPNVLEYEDKKNPLGPLQDIGRIIRFGEDLNGS